MQEVRSSNLLSSTGQKRNSNRSNSEYSSKVQQRRPSGPPYMCSDRYLLSARAAGKTADFSHRSAAFQACHLGKFSFLGICDTCRPVVIRLLRAVSRAVTVAVFADGLRAAGPRHPKIHSRNPRWSYRGTGSRIASVGSGRCAGWHRRACVLRRSGTGLRRGALWRTPARAAAVAWTGVPRRAGLIELRPPHRPPLGSPAQEAGTRPRAFHTAETGGACFGSVTVTWDTDGDCDCSACSPSYAHIADSARLV